MTGRESRDLERYRDLLQHALLSVYLSRNETLLLYDALQDTFIDASTARHLHHEVLNAIRHSRLDERYSVDAAAFIAKLNSFTDIQRMAILDAIEKAYESSEDTLDARLMATGLLAGKMGETNPIKDTRKLGAWIAHVNEAYTPEQRRLMRPDDMLLDLSEELAPNALIFANDTWAWWDEEQKAWFPAHWPDLARRHPLLPSNVIQQVIQARLPDADKLMYELTNCGCAVFIPKTQYTLPDGTLLTARWDGEEQWWFDLADAEETVITIDLGSGILCAELRSELGMCSQRKWRNGMFSYIDITPCG